MPCWVMTSAPGTIFDFSASASRLRLREFRNMNSTRMMIRTTKPMVNGSIPPGAAAAAATDVERATDMTREGPSGISGRRRAEA